MLDRLRVHVKGWLGVVILIMISIPFALFGLQNYTNGGSETPVAVVGDYKIYQAEANNAYQNRVVELKEKFGDQYSADLFDEEAVRQESLTRLVQEKLVLQTILDDGYAASDKAVLNVISQIDAFQKDGQFDKTTYEQLLQTQGVTTSSFVENVRLGIEREQFINSIIESSFIDDSEIEEFYRLSNQTRDIKYLSLPLTSVMNDVAVTDEEIQDNYAKNKHLYTTAEEASIDYVELSLANLMSEVEPTEEELLAFYESEQQSFSMAGHRRASHILFEVPTDSSEVEFENKRVLAEQVLTRLRAGESFAALAKDFSDDIGSAKIGGDLGIITDGMMGTEFEKTLETLNEGDVSDVIQTTYGYQIIKLTSKESDKVQPYDEVKNKVKELFSSNIAAEKFYQMAERFAELSFENPDSLDPLVDKLGLSIQHQANITTTNGDGVAAFSKVRQAIFNEEVLAGNNSDVIEVDSEYLVVLRINQYNTKEVMPLESVKNKVELAVKTDKAIDLLNKKGSGLLTQAQSGVSLKELSSQEGVTLEDIGPVTRNERLASTILLREAFSMPHPTADKPSFMLSTLENGDVALIELSKVTDGDKDDLTEASRESFKEFLARLTNEVTLAASLADLSVNTGVAFPKKSE